MSPAKILAVDDEPDFEALLTQRFRRQIRDREFSFSFAQNGEEALRMLEADPDIELILLDINMPVMDGLTLLSHLHDRQSGVKSIIVSAYGDMTNLRTAMNRGAFDFVTKPVDFSDLEITIGKTLADIAKLREMDRLRAALSGRAAIYPDTSRRTLSRCWPLRTSPWEPCGGRPSPSCSSTSSASPAWPRPWHPRPW
jgi:adenylate cyclase